MSTDAERAVPGTRECRLRYAPVGVTTLVAGFSWRGPPLLARRPRQALPDQRAAIFCLVTPKRHPRHRLTDGVPAVNTGRAWGLEEVSTGKNSKIFKSKCTRWSA